MASWRRRKMKIPAFLCCASLAIVLLGNCGPPLTQASSLDISGRWITSDSIGPLSNVQLTITQQSGVLSGTWSAKVFPVDAPCPPGLGTSPAGPLSGTNTVLEVRFSLLGAGDFEGQAIDTKTIKGSVQSCGTDYPIVFSLVPPPPS
jgi:hypothetical protein